MHNIDVDDNEIAPKHPQDADGTKIPYKWYEMKILKIIVVKILDIFP